MMDKDHVAEEATTAVFVEEEQLEQETLIEEDLLVEDISIDGMCGVY